MHQPPQHGHFHPQGGQWGPPQQPPPRPPGFGGAPPPPGGPPKKSRNGLVITISLILGVALIAGVVVVGLVVRSPGQKPSAQSEADQKPALEFTPGTGPPNTYGDTPIFDACNLVPFDELAGYGIEPDRSRFLTHSYLDESVPVGSAHPQGSLESASECAFPLAGESGDQPPLMTVRLLQTPLNTPRDVESALEPISDAKILHNAPDRGFNVIVSEDPDSPGEVSANIGRPDLALELKMAPPVGKLDANKVDTVRRLSTSIVEKLAAGPKSPATMKWNGKYADAPAPCDAVSKEAFEASYGKPATGYVQATYLFDEAAFSETDPPTSTYRVEMTCRRAALVPGGSDDEDTNGYEAVEASIEYWQDEASARNRQRNDCTGKVLDTEALPVSVDIGDGPTCAKSFTSSTVSSLDLTFKTGRATVTLAPYRALPSPDETANRLRPMAEQIISNLR